MEANIFYKTILDYNNIQNKEINDLYNVIRTLYYITVQDIIINLENTIAIYNQHNIKLKRIKLYAL